METDRTTADLFGDRASGHTFRGNHTRSWFSMAAQWPLVTVRTIGLEFGKASTSAALTPKGGRSVIANF